LNLKYFDILEEQIQVKKDKRERTKIMISQKIILSRIYIVL
jgi:hypothetical protein